MRKRTRAREFALQILYRIDIAHDDCRKALDDFWQEQEGMIEEEVREFTTSLVKGVCESLLAIDARISGLAANWQIQRMAVIDRNILRMGCYELVFCPEVPLKVAINEAVELAKKYSGPEAGKFVNGILDKIKKG